MMTLRYVFSETGIGLRRNVSMSVALIVTVSISLSLVALGALVHFQANKAERYWGSQLQVTAYLCNQNSLSPNCNKANVTSDQKAAIEQVLKSNPDVQSFRFASKQEAFDEYRKITSSANGTDATVYAAVTADAMQETYWITLKDPHKFGPVESELQGMHGVDNVRDLSKVLKPLYQWMNYFQWGSLVFALFLILAAVLQVTNTIRLATMARRREIAIMRLVGASTLYIALPFLIEILAAALIGVAVAGLATAGFMQFLVYGELRGHSFIMEWVSWSDAVWAFAWVAILGVALSMAPSLVVIRKYLKV